SKILTRFSRHHHDSKRSGGEEGYLQAFALSAASIAIIQCRWNSFAAHSRDVEAHGISSPRISAGVRPTYRLESPHPGCSCSFRRLKLFFPPAENQSFEDTC